eukprot:gnl/MRDRNA2_/MRDRNA2_226604_c0_seq1.p1 gnl/MRDRNA2_/MRDRNA2_226604_c0~~gnl/MRDRNA2_/MRDRNA2_226604_c0_seq1.p1  ORF type:complete len:207 (-),score=25.70 gnl/MRDRNA2_/MRDRNA2_226604_c0_seq1:3-539(-)
MQPLELAKMWINLQMPKGALKPQGYVMSLHAGDSISVSIRATRLPFCGHQLYLQWIVNLWSSSYSGALRIVEGGSEFGSCLLWTAAMLQKSRTRLALLGIDACGDTLKALRRAIRMNGWGPQIKVLHAALGNASSVANESKTAKIILRMGQAGEAKVAHSTLSCNGCVARDVPLIRLF